MAEIWSGKAVLETLNAALAAEAEALKAKRIFPTLGILRVGEKEADIAYEKGAMKRAETIGVAVRNYRFPEEISQEALLAEVENINCDDSVHGLLLFRPLPKHLDEAAVCRALSPQKDVDGITESSMAGVYAGTGQGYAPCTPEACMHILEHFQVELTGKRAVVIGRSLVVGKPAAMMLLKKNATVTVCHTKTAGLPALCREADILIVCAGKARAIGEAYFNREQIVIDVGINTDEAGNLCGDVDFAAAEQMVRAVTPAPGGVGTVTTSILMDHVIKAAKQYG